MALTLDATLAAAQDSQSRRPLVEIVSGAKVADIPFDGQFLTSEAFDEFSPAVITHSTGRLVLAYAYGPSGTYYGIKYVYTDVGRTAFTTVTIQLSQQPISGVSVCEILGGNGGGVNNHNIGIVYLENDGANHLYRLKRRIVTVEGVAVSDAEIANWSNAVYTSDPWVQTLGLDSFIVVYAKQDGANYYLYKRTSSNFTTWSAEAALSIGGLTSTWELSNPSLLNDSTGDKWLWFEVLESLGPNGERLTNLYYSVSADGGGTWAAAAKVTAYTEYSEAGSHPVSVQKVAGSMNLIYTRIVAALRMDTTTAGWGHYGSMVTSLSWDAVHRRIYATCSNAHAASKGLYCVVKIDPDTWTVIKYWDDTTTPGFPAWLGYGYAADHSTWPGVNVGDGFLIPVVILDPLTLFLIDGEADTVTAYIFKAAPEHSWVANVQAQTLSGGLLASYVMGHCQIEAAENKAWLGLKGTDNYVTVGYLDLTEPGPTYNFTPVVDYRQTQLGAGFFRFSILGSGGMLIDRASGFIFVSATSLSNWNGGLWVFLLSDGSLYKYFDYTTNAQFPFDSVHKGFCFYGGKLWGTFAYHAADGQDVNRGLMEMDPVTESIVFHRPSYASIDEYGFTGAVVPGEPGEFILPVYSAEGQSYGSSVYNGMAVFNSITGTWALYNDLNLPGIEGDMGPYSHGDFYCAAYDPVNKMIFGGAIAQWSAGWAGISMFSTYGYMKQATQMEGVFSGGAWTFGAPQAMVREYKDFEMVATTDPASAGSMFVFWNHEAPGTGENSIKWDRDNSAYDLSGFLLRNAEVVTHHSIDGKPYSLEFKLAEGHLFDPYNAQSLLSMYLTKGRRIMLRWGEKVAGTDYWQNAGTFYVTSTQLSFKRGVYSALSVNCQDERILWSDHHIFATDHYAAQYPEDILNDVLTDFAAFSLGRLLPTVFATRRQLTAQWIDGVVGDIIEQICNRFGYAFGFTVDDVAIARRITNTGAVVHTYANLATVLEYAPDNSQSDFTNRVTVFGQEDTQTLTVYNEERVGAVNGTCGWWGYKNDFEVWYSSDREKTCVEPRLVVLESATSIGFQLAGSIHESLAAGSAPGYEDKYCVVSVSAPNLAPILAILLGVDLVMAFATPDLAPQEPAGVLPTIPVGRIIERTAMIATLMILASTGNFQYEVWAKPIGYQYRKIQSVPPAGDDVGAQIEAGMVIEKKITDLFCYSQSECNEVAAFEIMVIKAQRNRVNITKIAHLQDEIGDTIRMPHPISGGPIDLFVTEITRSLKPGNDGYFHDELQGWKVN